ncbi:MAG: hypothetical protein CL710_06075 [Chloroflexi bacterium]|nr:hypothetical protein [Chloroflexota bacterium]|tara:strand:- start:24376 stop:24825 length:450 start_codon:yes stop_codon:yes gene_type:complete
MFEKIKKTLSKVVSKENKTKSSNSRARGNYNHRSRNRRKTNNSSRQNNHRSTQRTLRQRTDSKDHSNSRASGEVNKTTMYRSLASYRKRRDKLDPALPEDVAFRSPDEGGDASLKIHHAFSSYSQKDKARIIFHDKSIFMHNNESQDES